jgi:hypothetical protein
LAARGAGTAGWQTADHRVLRLERFDLESSVQRGGQVKHSDFKMGVLSNEMERAHRTENTIAYLSYAYFVVAFAACFCVFHMGWWGFAWGGHHRFL